jgi:hypothetical protein
MAVGPPGSFSYRLAIESACFVQCPLMPPQTFIAHARHRGVPFPDQAALEGLDREELMPPVGFIIGQPFMALGDRWALATGVLELREEQPFRPWNEIADEAEKLTGNRRRWQPIYSQWQLLTLLELLQALKPLMPAPFYQAGLEAYRRDLGVAAAAAGDVESLNEIAAKGHWRDLVLTRVQNVTVPRIRGGHYIASYDSELGDLAEWTFQQEESLDWQTAAAECGIDADWLAERYLSVCLHAQALDPLADWLDLANEVSRTRRERLQGDARVALDLYDEAQVLRRWHGALTGTTLPDVGDVTNPEQARAIREHRYGTADLRHNRAALPALLDDFGLYPWRVELIVEGESEAEMIAALLKLRHGLESERIGVHLIDAGGSSPSTDAQRVLVSVGSYANYMMLVFDNEGRARDLARRLEAAGVSADRLVEKLWKHDIETDNFTFDEICDAVDRHIQTTLGAADWRLNRAEVTARRAEEATRETPKALLSLIQDVSGGQDPPARFEKPAIAESLAALAHDQPSLPDGAERPVIELVDHLWLAAEADRIPPVAEGGEVSD